MKIASIVLWIMFSAAALAGLDEGLKALENSDYQAALKEFSALAEKGDTKAMVQVGLFYYEGQGVKQDYGMAMDWFLKAFSNQNADAFANIGVMYRDGQGVPANKKMAYCIFLTTHMCGLGSESTQQRSNSCLRRLIDELPKEDIKECLSNYTLQYMTAYIEARGVMQGIPDLYKPSKERPALRDLEWWTEEELEAIYGAPTPEEEKARSEKAEQRAEEQEAVRHTLVTQIRFAGSAKDQYESYGMITDGGMGSGSLGSNIVAKTDDGIVYENDESIGMDQWRYICVESKGEQPALIYVVKHPVKPSPCDWSEWMAPSYCLRDAMDVFSLCSGGEPRSKSADIPKNAPQLRFKVIKK